MLGSKRESTTNLVRYGALLVAAVFCLGCGSPSDDRIAELESQIATLSSTSSTSSSSSTTSTTTTIPLVDVPDLRGYDRNQAADVLRELGLFATFVEVPNKAKEGTVVRTRPSISRAEIGSTVQIHYAVPILHSLTVTYDVGGWRWTNLPDAECEYRDRGVREGQSVTLAGPDGVLLGSAPVFNGTVVDVGPDHWAAGDDGKVCRFEFTFIDIPEVATYLFATGDGTEFPTYSLEEAKGLDWSLGWGTR